MIKKLTYIENEIEKEVKYSVESAVNVNEKRQNITTNPSYITVKRQEVLTPFSDEVQAQLQLNYGKTSDIVNDDNINKDIDNSNDDNKEEEEQEHTPLLQSNNL